MMRAQPRTAIVGKIDRFPVRPADASVTDTSAPRRLRCRGPRTRATAQAIVTACCKWMALHLVETQDAGNDPEAWIQLCDGTIKSHPHSSFARPDTSNIVGSSSGCCMGSARWRSLGTRNISRGVVRAERSVLTTGSAHLARLHSGTLDMIVTGNGTDFWGSQLRTCSYLNSFLLSSQVRRLPRG
jgi:hypothetical protein